MFTAIKKELAELTLPGRPQWKLVRNSDAYLRTKKARALFRALKGKMHLGSNATYFDYFHEICHAKQCSELGLAEYRKLKTYHRELYVFEQIVKFEHRFTNEELDEAVKDMLFYESEFGPRSLKFMLNINNH
ncbi:zincin-like metallopeptidase toxin domain-containing protein [Roseimicrobium sp. ORNL1]|uniref:zincin-like metallopeptidase toxin domain-containing protein n=1 Tax=Roseimicrobium sp. ORNL1 TaxID=2711231 RepID=UPI0013E16D05|nr:zincin-like metallopeptidase toxin domain-containing protein [Roseimicrobium sp. ORNL1]QIF01912.1 hypothetical protein G5S37_10355 [Roseimicrobium sp. ORNL1]